MIRAALPADAAALGELHVRAWQEAYVDLMPAAYLAGLSVEARQAEWQRALTASSRRDVLACELDGHLAGFAVTGPSRDEDAGPQTGELQALYLRERWWGSGHASPLQDAALAKLRERGCSEAILWVVEGNWRAIRFYGKSGFEMDGKRKLDERDGFALVELRMRRPL